jgi:hypothetical protein
VEATTTISDLGDLIMPRTADDFMKMKMKNWPPSLQNYVMHVGKHGGLSGDVFFDCAKKFVEAGEPNTATKLIAEFSRSLQGEK